MSDTTRREKLAVICEGVADLNVYCDEGDVWMKGQLTHNQVVARLQALALVVRALIDELPDWEPKP